MGREQFKTPRQIALELSEKRDAVSAEIETIVTSLEVSCLNILGGVFYLANANQLLGAWWTGSKWQSGR